MIAAAPGAMMVELAHPLDQHLCHPHLRPFTAEFPLCHPLSFRLQDRCFGFTDESIFGKDDYRPLRFGFLVQEVCSFLVTKNFRKLGGYRQFVHRPFRGNHRGKQSRLFAKRVYPNTNFRLFSFYDLPLFHPLWHRLPSASQREEREADQLYDVWLYEQRHRHHRRQQVLLSRSATGAATLGNTLELFFTNF